MTLPPETPIPSQPLEYAMHRPTRPGVLTALAIIGIVVGSISFLASFGGIITGILLAMAGSRTSFITVDYATSSGENSASSSVSVPLRISAGLTALAVGEALLSLCAAILLIVAASLMLRDSTKSRRLFWIYVSLKLPLVVLAGFAIWWTISAMFHSIGSMATPTTGPQLSQSFAGTRNMVGIFQAVLHSLIALAFPVALIIVLATRTSKDYYRQIQSSGER